MMSRSSISMLQPVHDTKQAVFCAYLWWVIRAAVHLWRLVHT